MGLAYVPPPPAPEYIGWQNRSLESIPGLLKSLKIPSLVCNVNIVYGNLKSEKSQDYAQKPQRNCMFMNSAFVLQATKNKQKYIVFVDIITVRQ